MRVALVQNHPVFGEKKANAESLIAQMESAARTNAEARAPSAPVDLYILPELSYSGYQFISAEEAASLADPLKSKSINAFRKAARQLDAGIVFGFPERPQTAGSTTLPSPSFPTGGNTCTGKPIFSTRKDSSSRQAISASPFSNSGELR